MWRQEECRNAGHRLSSLLQHYMKECFYNATVYCYSALDLWCTANELLPFAKKLVQAPFCTTFVFQSSHLENWGQCLLMYIDIIYKTY